MQASSQVGASHHVQAVIVASRQPVSNSKNQVLIFSFSSSRSRVRSKQLLLFIAFDPASIFQNVFGHQVLI